VRPSAPFRSRPPWMPAPPPDPVGLLACSPATRRAHVHAKWRPEQQDRVRRRVPGEAPPCRPCLRRRRRRIPHARVQDPWIYDGRSGARTPSRLKTGPPWACGPRPRLGPRHPQPLDRRTMAQPSRFPLRPPVFLQFHKPVLPPLRIFTVRSCVLYFSPWPA
jgi:hypothetical protein